MENAQNVQGLFKSIAAIDWRGVQSPVIPAPYNGTPKVSVIIPTLNEAKNLPLVLPYLPMQWIDEVILVDGRSTDDTVEVAQQLLPSIRVILETRRGKGAAMKAGYTAAKGDILIVMDADGSNDPREIPRFIMTLLQGADMVKGTRFAPGGGTTDMPMVRRLGNGVFTLSVNLLFGCIWTDLCYGYHAFWKHCLDCFDLSDVDGFEIDTALYLRAAARELHVLEVPSFEGYRFYGVGKLQAIPDGIRVLKTIGLEWIKTRRKPAGERYLGFRGNSGALVSVNGDYSRQTIESSPSMHLLKTFGVILTAGYSVDGIMVRMLEQAMKALQASSGSILILDDKGKLQDGRLLYEGNVQSISCDSTDVIDRGLVGWVAKHRQPVVIENTGKDSRWLQRDWDNHGSGGRSAMVIPIMADENFLGVLTLVRPNRNHFIQADLKALESVLFEI